MQMLTADTVVVGAGAAGLFTALTAAREGAQVTLISATPLAETASYWAQGGLAAALSSDDSPDLHFADTLAAGRGLVKPSAARVLCEEAPQRARELQQLGVDFDADREGTLILGLEGGHSARRVVHAGGSVTGRRLVRELSAKVAVEPAIEVIEHRRCSALWVEQDRCVGLVCDNGLAIKARAVVLATGGAAALWERTTNPHGSLGSGLLLAHSAGAALADLEITQFHPTVVARKGKTDGFLITEAIRGEGAKLLDSSGERFVDELAPRDKVSCEVVRKMQAEGSSNVFLDMRAIDPLKFPNVFTALREDGIDPSDQLIPVAPAAHYTVGGLATDLNGRSSLPGLYAVGECSCTGLHGANRLASNSLSECFVFGRRAALDSLDQPAPQEGGTPPQPVAAPTPSKATRRAVWLHAGLEREKSSLTQLLDDPYPLARLIARSALARKESRGSHLRLDYPQSESQLDLMHTVIYPDKDPVFERWT